MLRRRTRPGPVPVRRDEAHAGDPGPLAWTEHVSAESSVADLLAHVEQSPDRDRR